MPLRRLVLVLVATWLPLACKPAEEAKAVAAKATAPAKQDCGGEAPADPVAADRQTVSTDATGATVIAVGGKLAALPAVTVAEVLARPDEWAGKTIRLEGNVSAMCTHRRAWFALQSEDKSGAYLRVLAAPAFLVPEGSIGKRARTEGVLELIEVADETAAHYEQEHQLSGSARPAAPQKTLVLKARGAEFI